MRNYSIPSELKTKIERYFSYKITMKERNFEAIDVIKDSLSIPLVILIFIKSLIK